MGKSLQCAARFHELSWIVSSANVQRQNQTQPRLPNPVPTPAAAKSAAMKVQSRPGSAPLKMETSEEEQCRTALSHVVADCAKRWFQDTLKEAKAGDIAMQLLVGQMYYSGYGVPRDPRKGHAWISKASRSRNSVWKVSDKHPGFRTSDSDSYELQNKAKFSS